MEECEDKLKETIRSGRRTEDPLNPQKYRYSKAFDDLPFGNTHIVAIALCRFKEGEMVVVPCVANYHRSHKIRFGAMEDTTNTIENETEENTEAIAKKKAIEIQEQINQCLKLLSLERLQVVADFVAYLADKESEEATQELQEIPGFVESFARGNVDISEGRITPLEQLKRKY